MHRSDPPSLAGLAALLCAAAIAVPASAEISLVAETGNAPTLFGDHMVLQRRAQVPVWGTATANVAIVATLVDPAAAPGSQTIQSEATTSNAAGRWVVRFSDLPVGGPYELELYEDGEASPSVRLVDVMVGDVWLLSGQSNMAIKGPKGGDAELYADVRAITTKRWGQTPAGAAFYFGAQLHDALGIPIGLVNRAVSDTAIGEWLPPETAMDEDPVAQSLFPGCGGTRPNYCRQYNQFIEPFERPLETGEPAEGMALRGIVWWQGEKGVDKRGTDAYVHFLPALIRTWRANLGQADLPFVYHQLPSGRGLAWTSRRLKRLPSRISADHWQALQRIVYFRALELHATSLMISVDLRAGTHPRPFDVYGRRFGHAALGTTYVLAGDVAPYPYSGPIYESATREPGPMGVEQIRVRFRANTAAGLKLGPDTDEPQTVLQGFALCCDDVEGDLVFADAQIENGDEVVVSHPNVTSPEAVHYSIGKNTRWANLFNGADLAAAPFSSELAPFPTQDPNVNGFWEPGPYDENP